MSVRYYSDPQTEASHIYRHDVSEPQIEEVLERPVEDHPGRKGSRVAIGEAISRQAGMKTE